MSRQRKIYPIPDHSVILWDKEYSDNPSSKHHRREKFSHDIPPKTPTPSRWNYVDDPPIQRSIHYTLIESKKKQQSPQENHGLKNLNTVFHDDKLQETTQQSAESVNKSLQLPLASTSRPISAPLPKSNFDHYSTTNRSGSSSIPPSSSPRSSSSSSSRFPSQQQQQQQQKQHQSTPSNRTSSYLNFHENPNITSILTEVTSSYHPPKVMPPFHSGLLPLETTKIKQLTSKELSRTGGGYINSKTGLAAGGNKFVKLHTITHISPTVREVEEAQNNYNIGTGKVLNQPGRSRNDVRLHKCVDDLIIQLCQCENNSERQLVKIEFTKTIRKFGKATKVMKDKYGRVVT